MYFPLSLLPKNFFLNSTSATVRRFGCQYRSCRWSILLIHCIQLKCDTGKVCNCLIQFLLTVILSILVEYVFREGNKYSDLTAPVFCLCGAAKFAVYRDRPRTLNELKTAITAYIRNISQADLQKVLVNKIKRVQACIDARGHHFQHFYKCTATFRTHCVCAFATSVMSLSYKLCKSPEGFGAPFRRTH
jgi:hypothetical protein